MSQQKPLTWLGGNPGDGWYEMTERFLPLLHHSDPPLHPGADATRRLYRLRCVDRMGGRGSPVPRKPASNLFCRAATPSDSAADRAS